MNVDLVMMALTAWREARGEGPQGMLAVAWVIANRVKAGIEGTCALDVVTAKWQFSSLTAPGDAMLIQWPHSSDPAWIEACSAATTAMSGSSADPTGGATDYANLAVCDPAWAKVYKRSAVIGHHTFFTRI